MRVTILVCALAGACACCAFGAEVNVIYQHNPYYDDPNNPGYPFYEIFPPPDNRVLIYHGVEGQVFELEAAVVDNGNYVRPGDIRFIDADADAGPVSITIASHDPGHRYGAANVKSINLSREGVVGTIAWLDVSGDVGELGPVLANQITGTFSVAGNILNDVEIVALAGDFVCTTMHNLTVTGPLDPEPFTPSITVRDAFTAPYRMELNSAVHTLSTGLMSGDIHVTRWIDHLVAGAVSGAVSVDMYLVEVTVPGELSGSLTTTYELRHAHIGGDLSGLLDVGTDLGELGGGTVLEVVGSLTGEVHVHNDNLALCQFTGPVAGQLLLDGHSGAVVLDSDLDGTLDVKNLNGSVRIGGSLNGHLHTHELPFGYVVVQQLVGGSIESDLDLPLLSVEGTITDVATITVGQDLSHEFTVVGSLAGRLTVTRDLIGPVEYGNLSATISIGRNLAGSLTASQSGMGGAITISGDLTSTGLIQAPGDASGCCTTARIEIWGSDSGTIDVPRLNNPVSPSLRTGHILVAGAFTAPGQIILAGPHWLDPTQRMFVCIGYDGFDPNQPWDSGAQVIVKDPNDPNNPIVCTGNCPQYRIYSVTPCRGDLNNDGSVDFADINPFILALSYPVPYAQAFPGLGCTEDPNDPTCSWGSRVYHGDTTCDIPPNFGFEDINPFVALVNAGCCDPNCPGCPPPPGGDGMEGGMAYGDGGYPAGLPPPEELAAQLAANVWPELYDGLLNMVLAAIDNAPDENTQAYWQAVYAALTQ